MRAFRTKIYFCNFCSDLYLIRNSTEPAFSDENSFFTFFNKNKKESVNFLFKSHPSHVHSVFGMQTKNSAAVWNFRVNNPPQKKMMRFFVDFNHHRRLRCHRKNFSLLLPQMRDIEFDRVKKYCGLKTAKYEWILSPKQLHFMLVEFTKLTNKNIYYDNKFIAKGIKFVYG